MSEMSNDEWEIAQKVKTYRKEALTVLEAGGSLEELTKITTLGMHLRISKVKEGVSDILSEEISLEEKAQLIAEKLVSV